MNEDDLRDVAERLEALESLAKLFGNSWLEYAKNQIPDEKVRAYLTVFDDAFPGMDHVVGFVRQNAHALAAGEGVQESFAGLAQALLQRENGGAGADSLSAESATEVAGETVAPDDNIHADAEENIEAVLDDEQEDPRKPTSDEQKAKNEDEIDALFG
ncbi:MAG: hypothetical protein OXN90_19800 [Gemmatimonadota bacterium]|nr:hypothetical protein [Gemmatimonadota bacterium]